VVDKRRGYSVVKEHFTENYQGVLIHDCCDRSEIGGKERQGKKRWNELEW
jgi:hypothetical protein